MTIKAKNYLKIQYPELSEVLDRIKAVPRIRRRDMPLPEAIVRVVTGQMLSAAAARTIYGRIESKTREMKLPGSWLLGFDTLRACGLSGSKAQTICELSNRVGREPYALDHWHDLPPEELFREIKQHRGMGDWTAAIIALNYVGHEDIFPAADGSLQRAITLIQKGSKSRTKRKFSPDRASPYRSYLALYLWRALDTGLLEKTK